MKSFRVLLILLFMAVSSDVFSQSYKIVGTGVSVCYNNSSVILCPSVSSEPFYGQDQGLKPSYKDNGDGTITDLITGLMWIKSRGKKMSWDSTFIMASQCNSGGYSDWRVPSIKELYSLINFNGKSGFTAAACIPYIDTNYFEWAAGNTSIGERVIDAQDWSSTKYKGFTMVADSTIFGVNFVDGRIKGYPQYQPGTNNIQKNRLYVRFVRGNTGYGRNKFLDNGDSTISDTAAGLMWSKNDSRTGMNWQNALAWVQTMNTQNYLGYNDWRLPTAKELQSIVDYSRSRSATNSAAIDPVFNITQITDECGNLNWPFFWSNTTHRDNNGAVYVSFGEALGWMQMPPGVSYYSLKDVHGAGAQRSDPKSGSYTSYFLGYDQNGKPVYGLGPQGDVVRINNFVRLVRTLNMPSSVGYNGSPLPENFNLEQNYPNPFNPASVIKYQLPVAAHVSLQIYDIVGNKITGLVDNFQPPGRYSVTFDSGYFSVPSGIYICRLLAGDFEKTIKMICIK